MKNIFWILCSVVFLSLLASGASADKIRKPAVAGKFYPSDKNQLSKAVKYYMESARAAVGEKPVALIAPHAGYIYSGQICADAFKQAEGFDYNLVVLLGTNHTAPEFSQISVYAEGEFETPLGKTHVDEKVAQKIIDESIDASFVEYVHEKEHSIEVLIPFVQELFPGAKIVPVLVGRPDVRMCVRFGKVLAKILSLFSDRKILIVASSDLSHYPSYADAVKVDAAVLDAILEMAPEKLDLTVHEWMQKSISGLCTCACGQAPIMAAMAAAKQMGAKSGKIISYANSGDAAIGGHDRVVGYGALAFFKDARLNEDSYPESNSAHARDFPDALDAESRHALLLLARKTLEQFLASKTLPLPRDLGPVLEARRGAFVTLKKHGRLRGCIGRMKEDLRLCQVVSAMAAHAAFVDRRFPPVTMEELPQLKIEISVLTPLKKTSSHEDINLGKDGVVLEKKGRKAVFLPQVALENGWDRNQMLDHLCAKAGLAAGSWKSGAVFHTFQAQVFAEE